MDARGSLPEKFIGAEGQLGYASVDTQPTPRRVSSLKAKIMAVAAANKHTAAVSESGEVFTWGCNKEGQLGYGTSNSSSNNTPRLVECSKGKVFTGVTTAKYHTVVLGADGEELVPRSLDSIFTVCSHAVATASPEIVVHIEKLLNIRSSEPWSHRPLPTPTATYPAIINSEEDYSDSETSRSRDNCPMVDAVKQVDKLRSEGFLFTMNDANQEKQVRILRKKLQQIEVLEAKQSKGHVLDDQQMAKLHTKPALESSLAELGVPAETTTKSLASVALEGKGTKKAGMSKKQKRKNKLKECQVESDVLSEGKGGSLPVDTVLNSEVLKSTTEKFIMTADLEEIRELGTGTYGAVYYGKWKGSDVAIKRIKASCFVARPSERERLHAMHNG